MEGAVEEEKKEFGVKIDGKGIAAKITQDLKAEVADLQSKTLTEAKGPKVHEKPVLGYLLVGAREDSALYVKMKKQACDEIGIDYIGKDLSEAASQ